MPRLDIGPREGVHGAWGAIGRARTGTASGSRSGRRWAGVGTTLQFRGGAGNSTASMAVGLVVGGLVLQAQGNPLADAFSWVMAGVVVPLTGLTSLIVTVSALRARRLRH